MIPYSAPVENRFVLIWTRDGLPFDSDHIVACTLREAEHEVFGLRILRGFDPFDCSIDCRVERIRPARAASAA
jgi:hypothetical protein